MEDLTALDAAAIAARVRGGWTSAADVARAHLDRIAEVEGATGAFTAVDPRRVLAEAECVDTRADRFALALAGVPVAVQDCVDVAGHPTRHGSAATSDEPARRDDVLVKRLRAAGALVIGKTRMPELAAWGSPAPGADPLGPGGPGGAAAAVAAGMATLAVGTDGGGSLRVAAAGCGLVGLKPGPDVVPLPRRLEEHWYGLSAAGPIARTADDAALLLGVLRGEPLGRGDRPGPGRVALSLRVPTPFARLHADHRAAAVGAAARLRAGPDGAAVVLADPPYPHRLGRRWRRRWLAGVAQDVAALDLDPVRLEPRTAAVARRGHRLRRFTPPRAGTAAAWRDDVLTWLDDAGVDLLLTPATAGPPAAAAGRGYLRALAAEAPQVRFVRAWNLAGLPAVVAPVRIDGRPVGVQLVGRPGSEELLLAAAARLEHRVVPAARAAAPRSYA
jgi:amidase